MVDVRRRGLRSRGAAGMFVGSRAEEGRSYVKCQTVREVRSCKSDDKEAMQVQRLTWRSSRSSTEVQAHSTNQIRQVDISLGVAWGKVAALPPNISTAGDCNLISSQIRNRQGSHQPSHKMRLFSSSICLLLGSCIWSAVSVLGKSVVGDRILVVMEDEGQRNDYAQLWKDLECE